MTEDQYTNALRAMSAAIFRDDPSHLTYEHLQVLSMEQFAAYWMQNRLPQEELKQARMRYAVYSIADMQQSMAFRSLSALFASRHIPFCPIKGADLAWRVYPDGGLRAKCDLDILVHKADLPAAVEALKQDGWQMPFQYQHTHHLPSMHKNGVMLEIHFRLPHLNKLDENAVWNEVRQIGEYQYRLPLEINIVMLFQHGRTHGWRNGRQLCTDCAFLLKAEGMPDWRKIQALSEQFKIVSPALLFRAFADLFPAESLPPEEFPPELCSAFRRLVFAPRYQGEETAEWVMSRKNRYSLRWWRDRLKGMRPITVRRKLNIPHGQYGKLLCGYWEMLIHKIRMFWKFRHGSRNSVWGKNAEDAAAVEQFLRG